jgi:hypothetical protein
MYPDSFEWCPFRPNSRDLENIRRDVSEVRSIQQTIVAKNKQLAFRIA